MNKGKGLIDFKEFLLIEHTGEKEAITSREIGSLFGLRDAEIRGYVNELRSAGIPICSNKHGYYHASSTDEIMDTINNLESRIEGIRKAAKGLEEYINETIGFRVENYNLEGFPGRELHHNRQTDNGNP